MIRDCIASAFALLLTVSVTSLPLPWDSHRSQYRRSASTDVSCRNEKSNICYEHRRKVASAKQLQENACLYCCYDGALDVLRTCKPTMQKLRYCAQNDAAECHSYKAEISVAFAKCRKIQT